ncbi:MULTISPECIES: pantoate--beta-alanine ligase [unclassified Psychrobacter]|uniref:pantoate--beta-alanine ligase n=1 Tax=unclassified Psychrobacter TaxID=196806 RepID=UPI0018F5DB62|nr:MULTISPECIES: pantoate--beta-alanine ligase [unclassified Psychrobacter]
MPTTFSTISELRATLQPLRSTQRIALVPTMGNLHDGHLELVNIAKQYADIVVVSIFVNPTQFGAGEDFDSYPRTLDADVEKLATVGADFVFAPEVAEMYPILPLATSVRAGAITAELCGRSRPTHFDGVGVVVSKLFNIVQPDVAVFGQKDYQQLAIIKQLVIDLSYPIHIISAPIIRAPDGLALSSRNQYLNTDERTRAPKLQATLQQLANELQDSAPLTKDSLADAITRAAERLTEAGFEIDYLEVRTQSLQPLFIEESSTDASNTPASKDTDTRALVILAAAWLGKARLLDNLMVTLSA